MPMTLRSTKHTLSFCVITFMLKYLKSSCSYFSNKMMDLVNIGMILDINPKYPKSPPFVYLFIHPFVPLFIRPSNAIRGADFP